MAGNDQTGPGCNCRAMGGLARFRGSRRGREGCCRKRTIRDHGPAMGGHGRGRQPRFRRRQEFRRTGAVAGGDRQPPRLHGRRRHARRPFRHSRHHRFGDGLLRASADARNRLRPPGAVADDLLAQFHLRQRRSLARPHHLGALRRLHELDPAARRPHRLQGRRVGQFRHGHGRFQPDLLDDRRAARRPPRLEPAAHRGPALHHDRDRAGQAAGRGRAWPMPNRRSGRCRR